MKTKTKRHPAKQQADAHENAIANLDDIDIAIEEYTRLDYAGDQLRALLRRQIQGNTEAIKTLNRYERFEDAEGKRVLKVGRKSRITRGFIRLANKCGAMFRQQIKREAA